MKYYAGIGARATPSYILGIFVGLASMLNKAGYGLRSGGADGADKAFEQGTVGYGHCDQIFLPWKKFNSNPSPLYTPSEPAYEMAEAFHPAWDRCSTHAKSFHARNCHQILGLQLDRPVKFVVCWTHDGKVTGGTGQALRIAAKHKIPIFNFGGYTSPCLAVLDVRTFIECEGDNYEP